MEIPLDLVSPTYTISRYTDEIYKIVHFKRSENSVLVGPRDREKFEKNEVKIDPAYSRARRLVLEYALCNPWDYFITLTLDKSKMDRSDLGKFNQVLSQFIRDCRKRYGTDISFLLIPELHERYGAWHMHGLLSGVPDSRLSSFIPGVHPSKLCNRGYKNWDDYASKFGFCSLAPIKDKYAVSFYITKYITKDLSARAGALGSHLYYASHGLSRAAKVSEVIGNCSELNSLLTEHYQFCDVGLSKPSDGLDWSFPLVHDNCTVYLEAWPSEPSESRELKKLDRMSDTVVQLALEGFS